MSNQMILFLHFRLFDVYKHIPRAPTLSQTKIFIEPYCVYLHNVVLSCNMLYHVALVRITLCLLISSCIFVYHLAISYIIFSRLPSSWTRKEREGLLAWLAGKFDPSITPIPVSLPPLFYIYTSAHNVYRRYSRHMLEQSICAASSFQTSTQRLR